MALIKHTSALTLNVAGVGKDLLLIGYSVVLSGARVSDPPPPPPPLSPSAPATVGRGPPPLTSRRPTTRPLTSPFPRHLAKVSAVQYAGYGVAFVGGGPPPPPPQPHLSAPLTRPRAVPPQ